MFRKPKKIPNTRKPNKNDNDAVGDEQSQPKKRFRHHSDSDDDDGHSTTTADDDDNNNTAVLNEIRMESKNKKKLKSTNTSTSITGKNKQILQEYKSTDPSQQITARDLATRGAEHHPTTTSNPSANINPNDDNNNNDTNETTKLYTGTKEQRNKFLAGPLKAPTFVRTTSRFDYQPEICKDYKETGFCGFGDTCIYLHDRGDTLTGWQLEAEWESRKKRESEMKEKEMNRFLCQFVNENGGNDEDDGKGKIDNDVDHDANIQDDGIPFACYLCRNAFTDPVVTSCGHYFCQGCILKKIRDQNKNTSCPICSKDTNGVFNHPTKLEGKKRKLIGSRGTWEEFAKASKR